MAVNVIAIDGPAASGKSSAARLLAEAIPGSVYVNTGSMYRAVAWKARKCGLDPLHPDPEKLASMLETTEMRFVPTPNGRELEVDGVLPGAELRTEEISAGASAVAAIPAVREKLVQWQRKMAEGNQIVMFYGSNSWSYTHLGNINDLTGWEEALGSGDITVTFSLQGE